MKSHTLGAELDLSRLDILLCRRGGRTNEPINQSIRHQFQPQCQDSYWIRIPVKKSTNVKLPNIIFKIKSFNELLLAAKQSLYCFVPATIC